MASIIKANQLQDFGGNSIITSDGAGNLTTMKTNYPAFYAQMSANQSVSNNAATKLQVNNEIWDTNSAYDTSNYRFTVPVKGKYLYQASLRWNSLGDGDVFQIIIYKNGSAVNQSRFISTMGLAENAVVKTYLFDDSVVGDYYELYGLHVYGSSRDANYEYTNFGGYRIGS